MAETATAQTGTTGATTGVPIVGTTTAPIPSTTVTPPEPNGGSTEEAKFTQSQLEAIVKDRLERERKKAETATAKAREDAEAAALTKNAEWQALAERRAEQLTAAEAKAAEVDSVQQRADRYEVALKSHLDSQRKDLPAHITALLDKLDPVEQLEWLSANREALTKGSNGVPATPKPTDGKALSEAENAAHRQVFGVSVQRMFR